MRCKLLNKSSEWSGVWGQLYSQLLQAGMLSQLQECSVMGEQCDEQQVLHATSHTHHSPWVVQALSKHHKASINMSVQQLGLVLL